MRKAYVHGRLKRPVTVRGYVCIVHTLVPILEYLVTSPSRPPLTNHQAMISDCRLVDNGVRPGKFANASEPR